MIRGHLSFSGSSTSFFYPLLISISLHLGLLVFAMSGKYPKAKLNDTIEIRLHESGMATISSPRLVQKSKDPAATVSPTAVKGESTPLAEKTKSEESENGQDLSSSFSGGQSGRAQTAMEQYAQDLLSLIHQRKFFPRSAKKMGHKGRVLVQFRVARSGEILDSSLLEKSPHNTLNDAAQKLVQELPRLKPFPLEITANSLRFDIPIEYK